MQSKGLPRVFSNTTVQKHQFFCTQLSSQSNSNIHIRFLLELAGALGFSPTFEDVAPFAEKHLAQLRPFLNTGFSESMLLPLRGEDRNALCEDLLRYLEYHTESAIRVQSLAVLREVFG